MISKRPNENQPTSTLHRQKHIEVKLLISELHQTVSKMQRYRILNRMLLHSPVFSESFLRAGALEALCLQLGFLLNQPCNGQDQSDFDQIDMICRVLDSFYLHCSGHICEASLSRFGNELLNMLIKVWKQSLFPSSLLKQRTKCLILSIWHSLSKFPQGSLRLVKHEGILWTLKLHLLSSQQREIYDGNEEKSFIVYRQQEKHILTILKNVTNYAENYRLVILGKFGAILTKLSSSMNRHKLSIEILASIFRNLAMASHVRLAMVESLSLISAMLQLLLFLGIPNESNHCNTKAIRTMLCAIASLCIENDTCLRLFLHGDGILLGILFQYLTLGCSDDGVRCCATRILRLSARCTAVVNLLMQFRCKNQSDKSADFYSLFYQVARYDPCFGVREEATMGFTTCVTHIFSTQRISLERDEQLYRILNELAELAEQVPTAAPEALAKMFKYQVQSLLPEQQSSNIRIKILRHHIYIKATLGLALCPDSSHTTCEQILSALVCLAQDKSLNCDLLVTDQVLKFLVHIATIVEPDMAASQQQEAAILALLKLASKTSRIKQLVTHVGLLHALIRYATTCNDDAKKEHIKTAILDRLIPQL